MAISDPGTNLYLLVLGMTHAKYGPIWCTILEKNILKAIPYLSLCKRLSLG